MYSLKCHLADDAAAHEVTAFERAVLIIKFYETFHRPEHWPTIGYGHVVQSGEPYRKGVQLTESQADALLRKDLRRFCALYRSYGADSLLLACLSYNCGTARVIGGKEYTKSRLLRKLESGDRNILADYLSIYLSFFLSVCLSLQRQASFRYQATTMDRVSVALCRLVIDIK